MTIKATDPNHNAPAFDSEFRPCWNVWVTGDRSSPHTFHTHAEADAFATRKSEDGLKVFTDFEYPLPLGIRP